MRTTPAQSGRQLSSRASRTVAIKSEEQQAILALHRMRQQLVKFRTAQINCLRGLLTEYGEVMPQGSGWHEAGHGCGT